MGGALLAVGLFGAVLAYAVVQANAPRAPRSSGGDGGAPADMPQRIERFFASNPSPEQIDALAAELERAGLAATAQQLRAIAAQRRASASSSSTTASSTSASSSTPRASSSSTSTAAETMEQELARMGMTREALDRQLATLGAEEDDVAELRRQGYPRIADYVETRVREGRAREAAATRESAPPRSSSSSTREEAPRSTREDAPRSSSTSSSSLSSARREPPPAMPPPPIERSVEGEGTASTLEQELARAESEHPGSRAQYDRAMREATAADLRTIARPVRTRGYPLIADSLEQRATELDLAAHREREAGSSSEPREERSRRDAGTGTRTRETAGSRESGGGSSSSSTSSTTTTSAEGVDLGAARRLAPRVAQDVQSRRYNYSRDRMRAFQRAAGLVADGEYGGATRGALIYFGVRDAPAALFRPTATVRYTPPAGAASTSETASTESGSGTGDRRTALA